MNLSRSNIDEDFSFPTKNGRRYSPAIRKLYYTLLSQQIPSVKIADMIKTVIIPAIDVDQLKLPQRSCADYMRKCELTAIRNAHKATVLCESASESTFKGFRLNTDGTTKRQKKIGAVGIDDLVISVYELPDGSADSAINDVSRELETLLNLSIYLMQTESIGHCLLPQLQIPQPF